MAHRPPPEGHPHHERRHPGILGSLIGGVATGVGGVLQGAGQIVGGTLHGVGEIVETVAGAGRRPHHHHQPEGPPTGPPPPYGPPNHTGPPPNHGGPPSHGYPPCNHWRSTDGCDSCHGWKWA